MTKDEVKAILATAVAEGLIERKIMKNVKKTPYYYFTETDVKKEE